jgi:hypothetical protein
MTLYFIAYEEDPDRNYDWFVSAPDPLTAFVAWRDRTIGEGYECQPEEMPDHMVTVFRVPQDVSGVKVHPWAHDQNNSWVCELRSNTLGMMAILEELRRNATG